MSFKEPKIEISGIDVASFYAFGHQAPNIEYVSDPDEFFIVSFTYADVAYKIKAYGEVLDDDGMYSVSVRLPDNAEIKVNRYFLGAVSAVTAMAFLSDRRERLVKVAVSYFKDAKNISFESVYDRQLADKYLERIMRKLHRIVFVERKISEEALSTLKALKFPYKTMREGQEIFIRKAYNAIRKSSRIFVEAPTGIGKTISALYSALRGMGEGYCDKIFYLTAKGSTSNEALKACEKLFSAGAKFRCVQLSAKHRVCPFERKKTDDCDQHNCPLMKGYYSRAEEAIYELISSRYGYSLDVVCETARKYNICPYEFSLDLSEMCGVVICDYNYVFDPKVRIRRYFDDNAPKKNYVLLIDEAHNLVSRAKEMYSSEFKMSDVIGFYTEISDACREESVAELFGGIKDDLNGFAKKLKKISRLCNDSVIVDPKGVKRGFYLSDAPMPGLAFATADFYKKLDTFCENYKGSCIYDSAKTFLASLSSFLSLLEGDSDGMRYYIEIADKEITFKCMCVDPSAHLKARLAFSSAAVFFSATFSPSEYYTEILSPDRSPYLLTLDSPFPKENRFCAIYSGVSTRFEKRENEKVAKRMLSLISAVLSCKKGNYMLYFPSYGYMKDIYDRFTARYPRVRTVIQSRDMSYSQKRTFIDFFENDVGVLRVGFCVLGGSFSEGIDLPGNRLIGTIIFGVGLPGISNEQNIIKEYYDYKGCDGYDFAYTYPGFNNVLQAAGRVIRSENDKGIIIFADDRYAEEKYKRMMPERFKGVDIYNDLEELSYDVEEFWQKN